MSLRLVTPQEPPADAPRPYLLYAATLFAWLCLVVAVFTSVVYPPMQWPVGVYALTGSVAVGLLSICVGIHVATYLRCGMREESDRHQEVAREASTQLLQTFIAGMQCNENRHAAGLETMWLPKQPYVPPLPRPEDAPTTEIPRISGHADVVFGPWQNRQPSPRPRHGAS